MFKTLGMILLVAIECVAFAGDTPDQVYREAAGELRCPTCTGLSVLDSDAAFSVQIKDSVRAQATQGKSKEEILQFFVERYGPWILRTPPAAGFNLVAWIVPIAFLVLGPPLLWFLVWRRRKVISTFGVRPIEAILTEFQQAIETEKQRKKA